jgi:hypothetical protein
MRLIVIAAAIAALAGAPALAQSVDSKGRCRTAAGKPAKAKLCAKGAAPDGMKAQMKCRDAVTGRTVKCSARNAVAVPAND